MDDFLNIIGPYIQVVEMADDLGSQNNLLISSELYKEITLPNYKLQIILKNKKLVER